MSTEPQTIREFLDHWNMEVSAEELEAIKSIQIDAIMCDWRVQFKCGRVSIKDNEGILHLNLNFHKNKRHYSIMSTNPECTEFSLQDVSLHAVMQNMIKKQREMFYKGSRLECIDYFRKNKLLYIEEN